MSVLVVAGLAAVFVYQSGLGHAPTSTEPVSRVAAAKQPPSPAEPEPTPTLAEKEPAKTPEQLPEKTPEGLPEKTPGKTPEQGIRQAARYESVPEAPRAISPFPQPRPPQFRLQDIWVTTNPAGARVVLDDNQGLSCIAPCQLHGVSGTHRLAVSQPGYLNETREIHLEDTALDVPVIVLRPRTGTLMLTSSPPGATIRINGDLIPRLTPTEIPLKPGSYSVTVEKDGASRTERIDLRESPFYLKIPLSR
jgi:hypothetical protein